MIYFDEQIFRFRLAGDKIDAFLSVAISLLPNKAKYCQLNSTFFSLISQEYNVDPCQRMIYQAHDNSHFSSIDQLKLDIVMPIHMSAHQIAAVICFSSRTLFIKDGLFNDQKIVAGNVTQWYVSKFLIMY